MLTRRQAQVCELVAQGMSNKAIARQTGIALDTVNRHLRSAADRIPGAGRPREKCLVWFVQTRKTDDAA